MSHSQRSGSKRSEFEYTCARVLTIFWKGFSFVSLKVDEVCEILRENGFDEEVASVKVVCQGTKWHLRYRFTRNY